MIAARRSGYILIETAVALALLSAGSFAVHRTIQEGIRTRGQAQDFTRARFLLDQTMANLLSQPILTERHRSGRFGGLDDRFSWTADVGRVNVPPPRAPLRPRKDGRPFSTFEFLDGADYLARVRVTLSWARSGQDFSESYETLLGPERLWQPPRPRPGS
jgi:hypothetical protein